jgi:hypothetical protein
MRKSALIVTNASNLLVVGQNISFFCLLYRRDPFCLGPQPSFPVVGPGRRLAHAAPSRPRQPDFCRGRRLGKNSPLRCSIRSFIRPMNWQNFISGLECRTAFPTNQNDAWRGCVALPQTWNGDHLGLSILNVVQIGRITPSSARSPHRLIADRIRLKGSVNLTDPID